MARALPAALFTLTAACAVGCAARAGSSPAAVIDVAPTKGDHTVPWSGLRWSVPSCPLRYELLTTERLEALDGGVRSDDTRDPIELTTKATLDITAEESTADRSTATLRLIPTIARRDGPVRRFEKPDNKFPALTLTTDGRAWRPTEPSPLVASIGTQGGLAWLLPVLPEKVHGRWSLALDREALFAGDIYAQQATGLPEGPYELVELPLDVGISRSEDGLFTLRSRGLEVWSYRGPTSEEPQLERRGEIRAEHVLSATGRLLEARLDRDVTITREPAVGPRERLTYRQRSEARLVGACDGPTRPSLRSKLSRGDRAVYAVADLGAAVLDGRADVYASHFTRAVRERHGDAAVAASIERYRKARGERAWGHPLLVADHDITTDGDGDDQRVTVVVQAIAKSKPVEFRFETREEGGEAKVERVTAAFMLEPGAARVLEVTRERVSP